jgi:hypothetical protein
MALSKNAKSAALLLLIAAMSLGALVVKYWH